MHIENQINWADLIGFDPHAELARALGLDLEIYLSEQSNYLKKIYNVDIWAIIGQPLSELPKLKLYGNDRSWKSILDLMTVPIDIQPDESLIKWLNCRGINIKSRMTREQLTRIVKRYERFENFLIDHQI